MFLLYRKQFVWLSIFCLVGFVQWEAAAQAIPAPKLWFSFNTLETAGPYANRYYADVQPHAQTLNAPAGASYQRTDRFGPYKAVGFDDAEKTNHLYIHYEGNTSYTTRFFGYFPYNQNNPAIPENITISCWIFFNEYSPYPPRKIFFADGNSSGDDTKFGLFHKGSEIYLRRYDETNEKHYNYRFWAPASLDAGSGWYHIILVMGKREDKAEYVKLYVGKPNRVKYDSSGPRWPISDDDPLASNFGGGYAFFTKQSFFKDLLYWGVGNRGTHDPVFGNDIRAVAGIDDFAIWDEALSENQAKALYDCMRVQEPISNPKNCWGNGSLLLSDETNVVANQAIKLQEQNPAEVTLSVFPNPTSGDLTVQYSQQSAGETSIRLYDLSGKLLLQRKEVSVLGMNEVTLNVKTQGLKEGMYLLEVHTPDANRTKKVVIQ